MESTFFGGTKQAFAQDFFGWVVGELEIMYTGVDRWVAAGASVDLSNDSEAWVEVGEAARRQR